MLCFWLLLPLLVPITIAVDCSKRVERKRKDIRYIEVSGEANRDCRFRDTVIEALGGGMLPIIVVVPLQNCAFCVEA